MENTGQGGLAKRILAVLSVGFVLIGLVNAMPGFPGLDNWARSMAGSQSFAIRKFTFEYFYPIMFLIMMAIVALEHSAWRKWVDKSPIQRYIGLMLDLLLVLMALAISLTYMTEIQAICLIDQITGERVRLIEHSLVIAKETAALFGLPEPTTVDDPNCVANTGGWIVAIVGFAVIVFLTYNVRVWGFPLVAVAIVIVAYTMITVVIWYFLGADDINKYFVTKLGGEPRLFGDGRPRVHDILTNNSTGLLGRFMNVILNQIFPYLILGSLFGASAGGRSLIKVAFRWTRNLRGGPAHAAIVSSAMFGTISGGPIINVLSTGVLTIPMMIKRGFSKVFAGGMEAAASSGGSIMPPVMGVAAFVLAVMTGVPYSKIIIAAAIPAVAYFVCLFLTVVFQSRKQKIQAIGEITEEMHLERQDILNLIMIFAPILLILFLLLTSKETIGCGWVGTLIGLQKTITSSGCVVEDLPWLMRLIQNAAGDAGSAGWYAVMLLSGLIFVDPEMRQRPVKYFTALGEAGKLISTLYLMFLAVSIIDFCLKFTGLPIYISLDVLVWLKSLGLGTEGTFFFQFLALFATMVMAILLGMGMPAVPAYINVALLMGPVLAGLGIAIFTAHMFIFYFAVASAITPPVALAAFAAASITKQDPMATGVSAVRSGIVMFVIPFVFAMYPEILLIEAAMIDPSSTTGTSQYLPGYDGTVDWTALVFVLARMILALYLLASALARFDLRSMPFWETGLRLVVAVMLMTSIPSIYILAIVSAALLLALHRYMQRREAI